MLKIFIITTALLLCSLVYPVKAQQIAFPGAEGFGRFASGGRGGAVYIVDNLSDNVKNPAPGSLRWAIKQKGTRTIVFAVSGTIALDAPLEIKNGDLTIAGQTAPGDGICVKNYVTLVEASNVVIRYVRFRCGNDKLESSAQDAISGKGQSNVIIDHCSMSWSIDETASFYDNRNFTMQWCIISESLYNSGHPKGDHGYGGIWGGLGASFHHNLLSCHTSRNPRFNGSRYSRDSVNEIVDFRNNVIFNWGFQSGYGGEEGNQNIVNNYYKPGPGTKPGKVQHRIITLTRFFYDKHIHPDTMHAGKFFIDSNYMEGSEETTGNNWEFGVQEATPEEKMKSKMTSPFSFAPVATQTAKDAYTRVLAEAGATLPHRDPIDQRIVEEVNTGKCKYGDTWGANTGIIDSQKSVGGWPKLKSLPAPTDTDKDGMPDAWEKKMKLNPKNPEDRNSSSLDKNYTNLEVYLNSLVK